ncbi:glutamate--tRNA ligase, partial [bacterium]|nr:glutamate--tRNA ligase [bacterium]
KEYLTDNEVGMGAVLPNFRVLVTGKGMGPSMFQIASILGKEETLNRLKAGLQRVN